jgi:predicted aspartyl protease
MRTPFSFALFPPAPALEVRLRNPLTAQQTSPHLAVLDTGADISIVPLAILTGINARPLRKERVRGLWGGVGVVYLFNIDIEVNERLLEGVQVVGSDQEESILLGRNLSNHLRLLIDGPDQSVELLT